MKKSSPQKSTIIAAAIDLFQEYGYSGTKMKDLANATDISVKELKTVYANKDILFKDVFIELYGRIVPQLEDILNAKMPVFEKIRHFTNNYVNFINNNKFLPLGLVRKINSETDFAKEFILNLTMPDPNNFYDQVEEEIAKGNIRPINPKQLLINIFALTLFPHVASPLMKDFIKADNDEFKYIEAHNNTFVADFIINSIKTVNKECA